MKTPIQELIEEIQKSRDSKDLMESYPVDMVLDMLEEKLPKEKQHIVTSFNCGIREEFENGMNYYNNVYEHRI